MSKNTTTPPEDDGNNGRKIWKGEIVPDDEMIGKAGASLAELATSKVTGFRTLLRNRNHFGRLDKVAKSAELTRAKNFAKANADEFEEICKATTAKFIERMRTTAHAELHETRKDRGMDKLDRMAEIIADQDRRLVEVELNDWHVEQKDRFLAILNEQTEKLVQDILGDRLAKAYGLA